uniref:Uncharacterized protein n=1 Tax=Oryza brachyantha TaxID=4533 RepID=J3N8K7_ORYBR
MATVEVMATGDRKADGTPTTGGGRRQEEATTRWSRVASRAGGVGGRRWRGGLRGYRHSRQAIGVPIAHGRRLRPGGVEGRRLRGQRWPDVEGTSEQDGVRTVKRWCRGVAAGRGGSRRGDPGA